MSLPSRISLSSGNYPYLDSSQSGSFSDNSQGSYNSLSLQRIAGAVRRRIMLVMSCIICLMVLSAAVIKMLPIIYRAEATVVLAPNKVNFVGFQKVVDDLKLDSYTTATEVEIITSRVIAAEATKQLGIADNKEYQSYIGIKKKDTVSNDEIVDNFLEHLSARPAENSRAILVRFDSINPEFSAKAANAVSDLYIERQISMKGQANQQAAEWLSKRAQELKEKLLKSEKELDDFKRSSGIVNLGNSTAYTDQLSHINIELVDARKAKAEAQARVNQIATLLDKPGGVESAAAVLNSDVIKALREQEAEVARHIGELRGQYRENHPVMHKAKNELEDLKKKIADEVQKIVISLKNDLQVAQIKERELEKEDQNTKALFNNEQESIAKLRALESEAATNKELYNTVLTRFNETGLQGDGSFTPDAQLISPATAPAEPFRPNKPLLLLVAAMLSVAAGISLAVAFELMMPGFHTISQTEEVLGIPAIGMLPEITSAKSDSSTHSKLLSLSHSPLYSEAIRSLRTTIFSNPQFATPKVVLVTSSVPDEGKTSTVFSLANMSRIMDKKCLLVDCDLRRSQLAQRLNAGSNAGLGDYLSETAELRDILFKDSKTGVYFVPAGKPAHHPLDLLSSRRMQSFIEGVRTKFDYIFLDAPPVLSVSDALVLSKYSDFTLYLIRWEDTSRSAARHGIKTMVEKSSCPVAVALSRVDVDKHMHYNYVDSDYVNFKNYSFAA